MKTGDSTYNSEIRAVDAAEHVPIIDMATVEADRLQALGPHETAALFPADHTHTSIEGAELNAEAVVDALRLAGSPWPRF